jgi:serine/threonine protein kinase/WD40 repeat protein
MDSGTPASTPEVTLASDDEPELTVQSGFGHSPPLAVPGGESVRSSVTRALPERRELGHYLLLEELGRGGMGVVYAARDRRLGRKVAIKMLRSEGDAKLARRLIREAKAMAKLAHPNVVTVHEIGEHEGAAFIVMEYVEGQTLRQWLAATPRSVSEILAAFMLAGRGLAAIHEAGLIHRDFKPDNLMIRVTGQVLVMDLGIARDGSPALALATALATASPEGLDDAPVDLTRDGTLMGSPAYMAAEQFSGAEVTSTTDQFSFCVSLWEALYGERPFAGETMAALIDAVSAGQTRAAKRSEVPVALRSVLERGLQVEPQARFESMTALLAALEAASGSRTRTRARLAWGAALVVALGSGFVGVRAVLDPPASTAGLPEPTIPGPELEPDGEPTGHRQISSSGTATKPALSPDGNHVVFLDDAGFVHVDLRSGETKPLAPKVSDVLGTHLANDGSLMFNARMLGEVGLQRMPSLDAAPVRIPGALEIFCRFTDRDLIASFELDDKHVKLTNASGSLLAELPIEGEYEWLREVACDPRNNRVAVLHLLGATSTIKLIDLDGASPRVLFESSVGLSSLVFDETGETLYYLAARDGQTNLEAIGIAVDDKLPVTRVVAANLDATAFSRADSGRVAYARTRTVHRDIWRIGAASSSLEHAERIVETDAEELLFAVSPDQTQLAYVESRRNLGRLMIRSLTDGSVREVTRGDRLRYMAWSPDGQTIAFLALYRGQTHVWTVPAAGGMPKVFKRALASDEPPLAWAPGERILYERPENRNFALLDPITEDERALLGDEVGWPFFPAVSPDGDSVAVLWSRDPVGLWTIDIEHGTPRLLATGEYYPITWSADGRFIYAETPDNSTVKLYRVPAEAAPEGEGSTPPEPWRTVDFGPRRRGSCAVLSTEELLCGVIETAADIWIAEAIQ